MGFFKLERNVTKIELKEGIIKIGEYLNVPKVKKIGSHCLEFCNKLQKLDMPELEEMGSYCLTANRKISQISNSI